MPFFDCPNQIIYLLSTTNSQFRWQILSFKMWEPQTTTNISWSCCLPSLSPVVWRSSNEKSFFFLDSTICIYVNLNTQSLHNLCLNYKKNWVFTTPSDGPINCPFLAALVNNLPELRRLCPLWLLSRGISTWLVLQKTRRVLLSHNGPKRSSGRPDMGD